MKTKIVSELRKGLGFPQSRGEVAAQEQISMLRQAMTANKGEPQVPKTRGQVAVQEQARIFREDIASKGQPWVPQSRGEVAAQEQMRILQQASKFFYEDKDSSI